MSVERKSQNIFIAFQFYLRPYSKEKMYNNPPLMQEPIKNQGPSTDCFSHFHLSTEMNDHRAS